MCAGIIDFAKARQAMILTPFPGGCHGAGHASRCAGTAEREALADDLAQIVQPGAPVVYGGFTNNVDMKTGTPAFGTLSMSGSFASGQRPPIPPYRPER